MFSRFNKFISEKQLFEPHQKVLLAVSGGIDSMVLLHLFEKSSFNYGVVHCNFQLRDVDSDKDEEFVREKVLAHGIPFFTKRFETVYYAGLNKISVEMAARELRYEYFEKIREENQYDYIATAHHQDDVLETFFLNLSRKTGIRGLAGIKEKNGCVIRPLLFAGRNEIEAFARKKFIASREDRTNNEIIYHRNFIRNRILPQLTQINPSFRKNMAETVANLREAEEVYSFFIEKEKKKVLYTENDEFAIDIESLLKAKFPKVLLFEILSGFNFNSKVVDQVFKSLHSLPGRQFFSKTHRLVKDRGNLYITPLSEADKRIFYLEEGDTEVYEPFRMVIENIPNVNFKIEESRESACIDANETDFPLLIRKWRQGDYFRPLGMSGFKKISDFLVDEKIPVHQKENIWLLCSGQKIIWVMGLRLDDRFKITEKTTRILKFSIT